MSRTAIYKGIYFSTVIGGIALGAWLATKYWQPSDQINGLFVPIAVVVLLLIPGRVLGYYWRDLLAGLRLLKKKEYAASKLHSERFLADVRKRPWLKNLIWLGSAAYSRDPEAMALTNLGAAEIGLGEFDVALEHLERALALDPKNPLACYNIAILHKITGAQSDAEHWFNKAKELGYTRGITDKVVQAAQRSFAFTDGRIDPELKAPRLSPPSSTAATATHVVELINDDKTPMEFVVWVLKTVFDKTHAEAVEITLAVHQQGSGVCGVYDRGQAEARVSRVTSVARKLNFPLTCRIVPPVD